MIVVSTSDFLKSPAQYVERAKHTAVMLEGSDVTLSRTKPRFFTAVANFFNPKPRPLGILEGVASVKFIGNWEVSPEELFDADDEYEEYTNKSLAAKEG